MVKFLEAGDKPFYIGFGSIVVDDPKKLSKTVISAIENARTPDGKPVRAIVHQGWAKLGEGLECGPNIFLLNKPVPHDWLFPLCSSACHHGGAGTMAAGLRVGLPTIVVPFFGDQPFWGSVVAAKKVGPEPIFNTDINPKNLKEAIEYCYQNDVIEAAQALGKLLMEEDGVAAGVDAFLKKVPATGGKFMVEIWENQRNPEGSKVFFFFFFFFFFFVFILFCMFCLFCFLIFPLLRLLKARRRMNILTEEPLPRGKSKRWRRLRWGWILHGSLVREL